MAVNTASDSAGERRRFVALQAAKAGLGAALGLGFFGMVGRPDLAEAIAMAGLMAPVVLALLGLTRLPLAGAGAGGAGGLCPADRLSGAAVGAG